MKQITGAMVAIALGCGTLASNVAHASTIQSMTIEEIGVASGGLGTSAAQSIGGEASAYTSNGATLVSISGFISAGSTDGKIIMGIVQGNNAFTLGLSGGSGEISSLRGAFTGTLIGGVMSLDLSGFTGELGNASLSVSPDNNLITSASMIDSRHFYYTADWSHVVAYGEVINLTTNTITSWYTGSLLVGHLEGIATLAPVPEADTYAMMLTGLGLIGLMTHRRRKSA